MLKFMGIAAAVFGVATIASGGMALFGGQAARLAVGNAVPFVLWFNFLAGFAYIVGGVGMIRRCPWALPLAIALAASTFAVFTAFGVVVAQGAPFEMRTVAAMALRIVFWTAAAVFAYRQLHERTSQRA